MLVREREETKRGRKGLEKIDWKNRRVKGKALSRISVAILSGNMHTGATQGCFLTCSIVQTKDRHALVVYVCRKGRDGLGRIGIWTSCV